MAKFLQIILLVQKFCGKVNSWREVIKVFCVQINRVCNICCCLVCYHQKLVSTWKRYWFVLKDQLLLYYKSQLECLNLSACRGSLNMGLVSCVRPGAHRGHPATGTHGYTIEVVTRTQVVILVSLRFSFFELMFSQKLHEFVKYNILLMLMSVTSFYFKC